MWEVFRSAEWKLNPFALLPLTAFLLATTFAVLIWIKRARVRARGPSIAPIAILTGLWNLGSAVLMLLLDDRAAIWVGRGVIASVMLVAPFSFAFATTFVQVPFRRAWLLACSLVSIVMALACLLDPRVVKAAWAPPWGGRYPLCGLLVLLPIGFVAVAMAGATGIVMHGWLRTPPSRRRRQQGYVALSYLTAMGGLVDLPGVFGEEFFPLNFVTSQASLALAYTAVVRYRLMDIRTAMHRTFLRGLAVVVTIAPLYVLVRVTESWAGWRAPLPRTLVIAFALFAGLYYVTHAEAALTRLFSSRQAVHAKILERLSAGSLAFQSPHDLLVPIGHALREAARAELLLACFSVDLGEGPPRTVTLLAKGTEDPGLQPSETIPHEVMTLADADPSILAGGVASRGPRSRATEHLALHWLSAASGDLFIPMRHGQVVIGAIVAKTKGGRAVLDESCRGLLVRIAARAAVVLANAALYSDLERRSAELEYTVSERTSALARAVTDLKHAQASLVHAEKQSSLGLLVAGISHEINNALNFIYGNVPALSRYLEIYEDLLARATSAGAQLPSRLATPLQVARASLPHAMSAISDAAHKAHAIIGDLRRFARRDEAERKRASVCEGLDSTLSLLRPVFHDRIRVERRYAPSTPQIDCYPAALNHVFLNVLLNAAQAIDGEGCVSVAVEPQGEAWLAISITDTGRGVPASARDRVFEPFFTTKRRAAGLGLAVSRQVVVRHGGHIDLSPNPYGKGTVVKMMLPMTASG
ncbi:MAG: hypothetical protein HY698_03230 [Deltaproteobacteria bacterium]|nr:hypothetical protein [Deltaproteobacteria bacterium]